MILFNQKKEGREEGEKREERRGGAGGGEREEKRKGKGARSCPEYQGR